MCSVWTCPHLWWEQGASSGLPVLMFSSSLLSPAWLSLCNSTSAGISSTLLRLCWELLLVLMCHAGGAALCVTWMDTLISMKFSLTPSWCSRACFMLCTQEQKICQRYDQLMEAWEKKVERMENNPRRKAKESRTREYYERQFPEIRKQREQQERFQR